MNYHLMRKLIRREVRREFRREFRRVNELLRANLTIADTSANSVAVSSNANLATTPAVDNSVQGNPNPGTAVSHHAIPGNAVPSNPIAGNPNQQNAAVPNRNDGRPAKNHPDANGNVINHPTAQGEVMADGMFRCLMNGCGTAVKNEHGNIRSHLNKHDPNSTYRAKEAPNQRFCGVCGRTTSSFNNLVKHIRDKHDIKGSTAAIWAQYATTQDGDTVDVMGGRD